MCVSEKNNNNKSINEIKKNKKIIKFLHIHTLKIPLSCTSKKHFLLCPFSIRSNPPISPPFTISTALLSPHQSIRRQQLAKGEHNPSKAEPTLISPLAVRKVVTWLTITTVRDILNATNRSVCSTEAMSRCCSDRWTDEVRKGKENESIIISFTLFFY